MASFVITHQMRVQNPENVSKQTVMKPFGLFFSKMLTDYLFDWIIQS